MIYVIYFPTDLYYVDRDLSDVSVGRIYIMYIVIYVIYLSEGSR